MLPLDQKNREYRRYDPRGHRLHHSQRCEWLYIADRPYLELNPNWIDASSFPPIWLRKRCQPRRPLMNYEDSQETPCTWGTPLLRPQKRARISINLPQLLYKGKEAPSPKPEPAVLREVPVDLGVPFSCCECEGIDGDEIMAFGPSSAFGSYVGGQGDSFPSCISLPLPLSSTSSGVTDTDKSGAVEAQLASEAAMRRGFIDESRSKFKSCVSRLQVARKANVELGEP